MQRISTNGNSNISLRYRWAAASDKGKMRQENEDTFLVDPALALFVVSDGMGGHPAGAVASKLVADFLPALIKEGLKELRTHSTRAVKRMLKKVMFELNNQMLIESDDERGCKGMGATVVMGLLINERIFVANIGDSRLYLLRKGRLRQLTEDHSTVALLLQQGKIDQAESEDHPERGYLTRYIGIDAKAEPHVRTLALKPADRLLLCTDGLTDVADDNSIRTILSSKSDSQQACQTLIDAANSSGGYDNTTVIVIDFLSST